MLCCCRALLLPKGATKTQVPRFWLRVLRSADAAALAISPRDAAVLSALADVRFSLDAGAEPSELQGKCECWRAQLLALIAADSARLAQCCTAAAAKALLAGLVSRISRADKAWVRTLIDSY